MFSNKITAAAQSAMLLDKIAKRTKEMMQSWGKEEEEKG